MNIQVKTDKIFHSFSQHINEEKNERILFTSAFGTGKSTFLAEYFERFKDYYNVFKIYPVSYSVSQNEDVFELLKYDLLFQLIENYEKEIELQNDDFSSVLAFQFKFLKEAKWTPILFKLIELADNTGRSSVIEKLLDNVKEQYDGFKSKQTNEEEDIYHYLYKQYSKTGSPKENDLITQLIKKLLSALQRNTSFKENETEEETYKQNVLIVDDLDRLDPEHIFRLFNIFSVNFGASEIENKFGLDKIIFVCDIVNIREIYSHRYGRSVDFEGYIDKFYSTSPFVFNTNKLIHEILHEFLTAYKLPATVPQFKDDRELSYNPTYVILKSIVNALLTENKINLRTLINTTEFTFEQNVIQIGSKQKVLNTQMPIWVVFAILKTIFDSESYLREILEFLNEKLSKSAFNYYKSLNHVYRDDSYNYLVESCLPFILNHKEIEDSGKAPSYGESILHQQIIEELNVTVEFSIGESRNSMIRGADTYYSFRKFYTDESNLLPIEINPFKILLLTFHKINSMG